MFYIFMEPYDAVCSYWNNYKNSSICNVWTSPGPHQMCRKNGCCDWHRWKVITSIVEIGWLYSID